MILLIGRIGLNITQNSIPVLYLIFCSCLMGKFVWKFAFERSYIAYSDSFSTFYKTLVNIRMGRMSHATIQSSEIS